MNDPFDTHVALMALIGMRSTAFGAPRTGLPGDETTVLVKRVAVAKRSAGLNVRQFSRLDRRGRIAFCAQFGLTHSEVRLAQSLVNTLLVMRHTARINAHLVRVQQATQSRGVRYQ